MSGPVELTQRLYETLATTSGHPAIARYLHRDCEWVNNLPHDIAFGGVHRGHLGVAAYFDLLAETIRIERFEIEDFIETENTIAVYGRERSLVRSTNLHYEMRWLHVVRTDGAFVASVIEYNDVPSMMDAFRPRTPRIG